MDDTFDSCFVRVEPMILKSFPCWDWFRLRLLLEFKFTEKMSHGKLDFFFCHCGRLKRIIHRIGRCYEGRFLGKLPCDSILLVGDCRCAKTVGFRLRSLRYDIPLDDWVSFKECRYGLLGGKERGGARI